MAGDKMAAEGFGRSRFAPEPIRAHSSNRDRYAFNGFSSESRRVAPPELDAEGSANALRENTTAKRKAAEEEARQKALWAQG